jgi:FkbM family methyltransferase
MNKITANIIKGIVGRLKTRKTDQNPFEIGWLQTKILKHQDDQRIKSYRFRQFQVWYKRPYELLHTYRELFINGIYRFTAKTDMPVIIDCGANIGMSVLYFKQLYPHSHIEAFEPDMQNFELLSKNLAANKLESVQLYQAAVWTSNGTVLFNANASEASHVSENKDNGTIAVTSIRLAEVLQKFPRVDFLKMDIEGAEWNVVPDAAHELKRVDHFFLEYHGKAGEAYKLAGIMDILISCGFAIYIKNAADSLQHPFVQKSTHTIYDIQLNIFCYRNA